MKATWAPNSFKSKEKYERMLTFFASIRSREKVVNLMFRWERWLRGQSYSWYITLNWVSSFAHQSCLRSENRENCASLSSFALDGLASQDKFGCPAINSHPSDSPPAFCLHEG